MHMFTLFCQFLFTNHDYAKPNCANGYTTCRHHKPEMHFKKHGTCKSFQSKGLGDWMS